MVLRNICPTILQLCRESAMNAEPPAVAEPENSLEREQLIIEAFADFFRLFVRCNYRLVLFLDDLQWADVPSLRVISSLPLGSTILGAFRSDEVQASGHPFAIFESKMRESTDWDLHVVELVILVGFFLCFVC
jgi:predicted ATPase